MPTRLLFVSRRETTVSKRFDIMPQVEMGADGTTQDDIREFVETTVDNLVSDYRDLGASKERLKEGLLRKAGNMFLFVKLKEDAIRDKHPSSPAMVEEIVETLDEVPPDLEKMYEYSLLAKCAMWNERLTQIAVRSLQWLLYSRTPVSLGLLRVVVAIDAENGALRVDDLDSCIEKTVKHVLGVLVDWQAMENGALYATLVHSSLREYLISCAKNPKKSSFMQILPDHLFKTCCAVLGSSAVRKSLHRYHSSADQRRQLHSTGLQRVLCQEEEWGVWEQRQKNDLDEQRQWRAEEINRMQEELDMLGDEAPPTFIENQLKRLKLLQGMTDDERQEVQRLMDMLYLPERELMVYALK
jgi:hypothetical protein